MFCKISWGTMNAVQTKLLLLRSTFILGNNSKDFYFVSMWSGVRIEQKHPLSFAEEDIECRFWQKMSMSPAGRKSLQFCNDCINWGEKACNFIMTLSTGDPWPIFPNVALGPAKLVRGCCRMVMKNSAREK